MKRIYKVMWDNGNDCGMLPGTFSSKRAAENAGRDWKREMVAIDDDRKSARQAYSWEVIEPEPSSKTAPPAFS